jgi:hypothetical protein
LPLDGNQNLKHRDWVITNLFPGKLVQRCSFFKGACLSEKTY